MPRWDYMDDKSLWGSVVLWESKANKCFERCVMCSNLLKRSACSSPIARSLQGLVTHYSAVFFFYLKLVSKACATESSTVSWILKLKTSFHYCRLTSYLPCENCVSPSHRCSHLRPFEPSTHQSTFTHIHLTDAFIQSDLHCVILHICFQVCESLKSYPWPWRC